MNRKRFSLNKSQRMQMKAFLCILGLLLLLILLLGRIASFLLHREEPSAPIERVPVIEEAANVWIMEADEEHLKFYQNGEVRGYRFAPDFLAGHEADSTEESGWYQGLQEQLADVELTDGMVTAVRVKSEKINGKILSADASGVEVEGYGRLMFSDDYQAYRIYNTLEMCTVKDLAFGYNFADLVMEDGKVCGILIAREEAMEYIRVLIKGSDYVGLCHQELVLTSDTGFTLRYGPYDAPVIEQYAAGEEVTINQESACLADGRVIITPDVLTGRVTLCNVSRSQGTPSYRGHFELELTEDGIVAVNELPLEEYLYCVVPSEMPASYPAEALKAQAVCARTYAYGHMRKAGYPQYGAHVDDSTSYQVYNNILEQASTTAAVRESYGQLLFTAEGNLAGAYYYSTSCGMGTDANIWKTAEAPSLTYLKAKEISPAGADGENGGGDDLGEALRQEEAFSEFIQTRDETAYEAAESWYRWSYQSEKLDVEHLYETLKSRHQANSRLVLTLKNGEYVSMEIQEFQKVKDIYIESRGAGGVCDELILVTDGGTYKVISEHNIRYVLNDGVSQVVRQDKSKVDSPSILPSGFFVISVVRDGENVVGYTLTGGGYGHGVGMSQNGAKDMAKAGLSSDEILTFFFDGCSAREVTTD